MAWDGSTSGGFTSGEPWLPTLDDPAINVAAQRDDPTSMLALQRALLALRRSEPALAIGSYESVQGPDDTLVYRRRHERRDVLIALNLGSRSRRIEVDLPDGATILLDTGLRRAGERVTGTLGLGANEGVVVG